LPNSNQMHDREDSGLGDPSRTIKLISTFPAGGPVDVIGRIVGNDLSTRLGSPVIVENRIGAGGTIGSKFVASSDPDGYTLLFASQANLIAAAMYSNPGYDPVKSFSAVASVSNSSWILVISPSIPAKSLQELIDFSKANPRKLNFGFGLGSAPHLLGELLRVLTGIEFTSVPYKGGGSATADLLSGEVHLTFGTAATLLPLVQDGRLTPLAVTGDKRWPEFPNVPTMKETGVDSLPSYSWTGLLAPAGLQESVRTLLNTVVRESIESSDMKASMSKLGYEPFVGSPEAFATFIARDAHQWNAAVKSAGVRID
jgi:tripartite-type tricarboxylate transporter receptor subunit TctC